jgi:hypothetical protein
LVYVQCDGTRNCPLPFDPNQHIDTFKQSLVENKVISETLQSDTFKDFKLKIQNHIEPLSTNKELKPILEQMKSSWTLFKTEWQKASVYFIDEICPLIGTVGHGVLQKVKIILKVLAKEMRGPLTSFYNMIVQANKNIYIFMYKYFIKLEEIAVLQPVVKIYYDVVHVHVLRMIEICVIGWQVILNHLDILCKILEDL